VAWLVRTWSLMFWLPPLSSVVAGWLAVESGIVARPVPHLLFFLAALLLQFTADQFSVAWIVGLVAQSALAVYLTIRLKLSR
jgi:hypothetical protein